MKPSEEILNIIYKNYPMTAWGEPTTIRHEVIAILQYLDQLYEKNPKIFEHE